MSTVAHSPSLAADWSAPPRSAGYFQRSLPGDLILGSFALVTLPLTILVVMFQVTGIVWAYLWLFGMTHFVLTFTVYFQSANLKHFANSWKNLAIFFAIPIALFVAFDLYTALQIAVWFPAFNLGFRCLIRLVDFYHFARQSFGVLQMFKTQAGVPFPKWLKRTENCYFLSLVALLQITFLEGMRSDMPLFPLLKSLWPDGDSHSAALWSASWVALFVSLGLFFAVLHGYRQVGAEMRKPLLYLLAQSAGGALAIVFFPLYVATLAMHYVEYHVLMYPRCFHTPLDPQSRLDRAYGRLRRHPWLFYTLIIAAAGIVTLVLQKGMDTYIPGMGDLDKPITFVMLLAVFDGIFVFHYFIEAFIWRFSDPYFRASMSDLYFQPKASGVAERS